MEEAFYFNRNYGVSHFRNIICDTHRENMLLIVKNKISLYALVPHAIVSYTQSKTKSKSVFFPLDVIYRNTLINEEIMTKINNSQNKDQLLDLLVNDKSVIESLIGVINVLGLINADIEKIVDHKFTVSQHLIPKFEIKRDYENKFSFKDLPYIFLRMENSKPVIDFCFGCIIPAEFLCVRELSYSTSTIPIHGYLFDIRELYSVFTEIHLLIINISNSHIFKTTSIKSAIVRN